MVDYRSGSSFVPADPQSWNRHLYTQNNPLKFTDPTGEDLYITGDYADGFVADLLKSKTIFVRNNEDAFAKLTTMWKPFTLERNRRSYRQSALPVNLAVS
jgi:hypothetical protein